MADEPFATPDQVRAAEKRKASLAAAGRSSAPVQRHAAEAETAAPAKPARKRAAKKKA